jgi:hypothetical protein
MFILVPTICAADLLGTATAAQELGSNLKAPHRVLPWFYFTVAPGAILFNDVWVDKSNVGTSRTATLLTDPGFAEVANRLTNGQVEQLSIGATLESVGGGDIEPEQSWFGLSTRDFKGALIDSIVFRVDALEFTDPNHIGGTTFSYMFSVFIHGRGPTVAAEAATWGRIKALYDGRSSGYDP